MLPNANASTSINNSLHCFEKLKLTFTESQARAIVEILEDVVKVNTSDLATKEDLALVKKDLEEGFANVKAEFAHVKEDIAHVKYELVHVKADIVEVKEGLAQVSKDILQLRAETKIEIYEKFTSLDAKIANLDNKMDNNFRLVFILGSMVSVLLLLPTLGQWLHPVVK